MNVVFILATDIREYKKIVNILMGTVPNFSGPNSLFSLQSLQIYNNITVNNQGTISEDTLRRKIYEQNNNHTPPIFNSQVH